MNGPYTVKGTNGMSLMNQDERDAILDAIGPEDFVLEIGSYHGASCRYWAERRPNARFLCVDNYDLLPDGNPGKAVACWMSNQQPNMNLLVGTSDDLLLLFPPRRFNVILVDGGHKEEPCSRDLDASRVLLLPEGTLIVHDYNPQWEPGVAKAVDAYCLKYRASIMKLVYTLAFLKDTGA